MTNKILPSAFGETLVPQAPTETAAPVGVVVITKTQTTQKVTIDTNPKFLEPNNENSAIRARAKKLFLEQVTPEHIQAVYSALLLEASSGNVKAIKEFLDRVIGKPDDLVDDGADRLPELHAEDQRLVEEVLNRTIVRRTKNVTNYAEARTDDERDTSAIVRAEPQNAPETNPGGAENYA